jgi:hypothetical protein
VVVLTVTLGVGVLVGVVSEGSKILTSALTT